MNEVLKSQEVVLESWDCPVAGSMAALAEGAENRFILTQSTQRERPQGGRQVDLAFDAAPRAWESGSETLASGKRPPMRLSAPLPLRLCVRNSQFSAISTDRSRVAGTATQIRSPKRHIEIPKISFPVPRARRKRPHSLRQCVGLPGRQCGLPRSSRVVAVHCLSRSRPEGDAAAGRLAVRR